MLGRIEDLAAARHLSVFGALHTDPDDGLGDGTIVLLGPKEPGFWRQFTSQPEFLDGEDHPLDRWSARAVSAIAADLNAKPLYPFGEPVRPFISWALRSGRAWSSPVGLLVHDEAGLMVSYRGAVLVPERIDLPRAQPSPCLTCADKPCLQACPVEALSASGYDTAACHAYLDTEAGAGCMTQGCAVRRSCPAGLNYRRIEAQSAYHMERFHSCR
ncbi:MAG: ferredoxin [Paracoccaceae bacterium]|nr:ferredoxin [Paracoccaceae bacterium]